MSTYHHGSLRPAVLRHTAAAIVRGGVDSVSLRQLAGGLGVSHTAIRHHFGSRDGVLTALAAEGFTLLAESLRELREEGRAFLDLGVAYVSFAQAHPAHFVVMFDTDVLVADDPDLLTAQDLAWTEIRHGVDGLEQEGARQDMAAAVIAGWSLMHGLVVLDRCRALEQAHVRDLLGESELPELARRIGQMLYGSPT